MKQVAEFTATGFDVANPSIVTRSGKRLYLQDPNPELIDINDIAHSLGRICRYNGHTLVHYSVAEHSVLVSLALQGDGLALEGLLHDAAEAYIGDVISPVKELIRDAYGRVQALMEGAIEDKFHCSLRQHKIKVADKEIANVEMACKMLFSREYRAEIHSRNHESSCPIMAWSPTSAADAFLKMFEKLKR